MPSPTPEADAFRTALDAAGWRCTPQRRAVYEAVRRAEPHHPTAEEVYRAVKPALPSLSLATVYKALDALVDCGLVSKLAATAGSARYDARVDHHYHLHCLRTGIVRDLPTPFDPSLLSKLDPDLARRLQVQGFRVTGYRLELEGYFEKFAAEVGGGGPDAAPPEGAS